MDGFSKRLTKGKPRTTPNARRPPASPPARPDIAILGDGFLKTRPKI